MKLREMEAQVWRLETDLARLNSELKAVPDAKNSLTVAAPPRVPAMSPPAAVPARPGWLDSLIVEAYPPLFGAFRMKRWMLLWRGSRDGFTAEEFHRRCDGHANTLRLILDTKANVFGGFIPVE
jgi:hypothetical protein